MEPDIFITDLTGLGIDPRTERSLREAIESYRRGVFLAASSLLGAAVEGSWYALRESGYLAEDCGRDKGLLARIRALEHEPFLFAAAHQPGPSEPWTDKVPAVLRRYRDVTSVEEYIDMASPSAAAPARLTPSTTRQSTPTVPGGGPCPCRSQASQAILRARNYAPLPAIRRTDKYLQTASAEMV